MKEKLGHKTVDTHDKNFLTESEMKKFLAATKKGRHSTRDYCMMLLTYPHGLRVSELVALRLKDIDLTQAGFLSKG